MEYAFRNRLRHLTQYLWDRYFRAVTKPVRASCLTALLLDIEPFPVFSREPRMPATANINGQIKLHRRPSQLDTCPSSTYSSQNPRNACLPELKRNYTTKNRTICMMNRRWSNDLRISPGWPHDQAESPDILHPRVFVPDHKPTYITEEPKITEVGKINVVKIVFEKDLGSGSILRYSHLYPYGEVKLRWRHFLMKYILEQNELLNPLSSL